MNIAIVHPYPVSHRGVGGVTRLYALVRHLAPRHRLTVLAHASADPEADAAAVRELAELGVDQQLFPRPRPGLAMRLRWLLDSAPYFVGRNRNPGLEAALCRLEREQGLDVVHLEFGYLAPLVSGLGPGTVRILAEQETMSLAIDRLRGVGLRQRTPYEHYLRTQGRKARRFEAAVLPAFHRLFAITPAEAERMAAAAGRPIGIVPHIVCTRTFTAPARAPEEPVVLFVGNYGHRPNLHALGWFVERVWPGVAPQVPGVRLEVVGPGLDAENRRRLEGPGIRLLGRVDDLVGRYRSATVFINPILSGGGMRGKVLEAFACARPVVSTRLGMEGIAARPETHYLAADDPASFSHAVVRYLREPSLCRDHGWAARTLTAQRYDTAVVFARLEAEYQAAVAEHRPGIAAAEAA
ncbi:MAG: glycosyltransferase [bacterium]|nr:glycosyltransferase [bacterium]